MLRSYSAISWDAGRTFDFFESYKPCCNSRLWSNGVNYRTANSIERKIYLSRFFESLLERVNDFKTLIIHRVCVGHSSDSYAVLIIFSIDREIEETIPF